MKSQGSRSDYAVMSYAQVGAKLGISAMRVCQLEKRALAKMRARLEEMEMPIDDRLTRCERAGNVVSFVNPSPSERDSILLHFGALKHQKHAVICDEVQHSDGPTELRIHHYLNCKRCSDGLRNS